MIARWHMRHALVAAAALLLARLPACSADAPQFVRQPAAAGSFYPDSAETLRKAVTGFLKDAKPDVPSEVSGLALRAVVVPHAGYPYSGPTAAYAYKLLEGTKPPDRVIILGVNHFPPRLNEVCSVADFSAYETPLGRLTVDAEARAKLVEHEPFHAMRIPHAREHSIEVELPFIQTLWANPPPIVPIIVGDLSPSLSRAAATALAGIMTERTLLIVSSDFTHYGERFQLAPFGVKSGEKLKGQIRDLDMGAVKLVEALDPGGFRGYTTREARTICGRNGIGVMLNLFSRVEGSRPVFLRWANSGDVTGRYADCVSYVAMAVYAPPGPLKLTAAAPQPAEGLPVLTDDEKSTLLRLARQSVEKAVRGEDLKVPDPKSMSEGLRKNGAAFVTLTEAGDLRGCIGHVQADVPLSTCVCQVAVLAALRDPRFRRVEPDELDKISIEISVLTPLEVVKDTDDIRVGRDGLVIERGPMRGLLLPQVATEYGWTVEEFLQNTCRKAGLPPNAWKEDNTTIYRFHAVVFNEGEFKN
jgi:AmmeMemoRadiSam system protein B/AmmeMemoRadiSam system protein A